ncbi:hypothetical protein AN642_01650 [Epulopiscium sp. SCG-B10WGA-EpuloA2]|nr:hypothetical protein AN642_01650 [Epulopiscium sp. SCG-B10WGA-EpuloA2]
MKIKLAPQLRAKKTVEGAIGGVIGASLMALIYCFIMNSMGYVAFSMTEIFIIVFSSCIVLQYYLNLEI